METYHNKTEIMNWQDCMRCGRSINVLSRGYALPVLDIHDSEQLGLQCIACGQITCFDCSDNRYRCTCGGNAWIARVYRAEWLLNSPEDRYVSNRSKMAWP